MNINDYLTFLTKGSFTLPATLNLQNMLELETFIKAQEIKSPIFTGAVVFREKFIIKLPPGVNIETLPPNIKIENVTGNFNAEYKLEENTIIYKRSLTIQKGKIQPAEYKDFQELIKPALEEYNARFFYNAKSDFLRQKALEIKNRPATGKTTTEKVLTATEVAKLETELAKNPEDYKLRLQLLDYYNYAKLTPEKLKIRTQHRKWVIKNRPETDYFEIIGWTHFTAAEDLEYQELKKEWLKALENKQDNFKARLAAIDFIESAEPILAETLLLEGEKIFRDKYEFPLQLFELYNSKSREKNISQTDKKSQLQKSIEAGERALVLLKKERSDKRDSERAELLPRLANIAIELDQTEKAGNFAKELILEFGDDATDFVFSEATHKGNIILGRIALKNNDLSKAKEYLFIAVNSALRGRYYSFYPDMLLAKELLAKGEKETILEYLKLCETFKGTDKLTLKKWQTEIKQGKTPKFEWY